MFRRVNTWRFRSGSWVECDSVPLDDRGFRYGMSVFETVAMACGRALFFKEHLVRLGLAAAARGWAEVVLADCLPEIAGAHEAGTCLPSAGSTSGMGILPMRGRPSKGKMPRPLFSAKRTASGETPVFPGFCEASGIGREAPATGVVRLYLTAGTGGVGASLSGSLFALFEPCEVGPDFSPLRVISSAAPYFPGPGGWKTGNYWQNVDALGVARSSGADEALLFNPSGVLVAASMANVFLQIDGRWVTPARETGARDGVVRAWAMERTSASEEVLDPSDVLRCSACFLTNSRVGIRAVAELDGRPLLLENVQLQKCYREEVLGS